MSRRHEVFEGAVYEYEPTGEYDYSEPDANTKVNYLNCPIVSTTSRESQDSVGLLGSRPDHPVQNHRRHPSGGHGARQTIQGLVTNEVQSLDSDERRLLRVAAELRSGREGHTFTP